MTPLRVSRDYRFLTASSVISGFGSFLTYVAVPFQIKELTGSALAVGLLGATELVPLVVCGLWGGALADAMDRRKLVVATEAASALLSVLLLLNALMPHPALWPIYALTAAFAAVNGLQRPSREAIVPRIVPPDLVVPAGATCYLFYATVQGNTSVAGTLLADATTFNKNVSVNGGVLMNINRAFTVKGNLSITNSAGVNGTWEQYNDAKSVVQGNFSYTYNSGQLFIGYLGLDVKGNFTFAYNAPSATDWPYTLDGLTVAGNSTIL